MVVSSWQLKGECLVYLQDAYQCLPGLVTNRTTESIIAELRGLDLHERLINMLEQRLSSSRVRLCIR